MASTFGFTDEVRVAQVCAHLRDLPTEISIKAWPQVAGYVGCTRRLLHAGAFPQQAIESVQSVLHEHCLVHAMACLVKDFNVQDFGELLPVVGGVSAMDMNRGFRSISSEMDMEVLVLVSSPSMDDLGCESSTWMCLEVDDAGNHHWWGLFA